MKMIRVLVTIVALVAFVFSGIALANDMYYVVKDDTGKMMVSDKKPAEAAKIVKGPFKTKDEAMKAMDEANKMMKK